MLKKLSPEIVDAWQSVIGIQRVLEGNSAQEHYGATTLSSEKLILAGLLPENVEEAIALVKIAAKYGIPLYPISTGNNWGYGSASPVSDGCVVMDLSLMNKILFINEELGLATVEPGVTSGQMHEYLQKNSVPFVAPMTGGGPTCSIIGNILERGRGADGPVDRFSTVMAVEAILADGTLYSSASGKETRGFFKWGVGPYIDGLFGQSNLGIVVSMTVALASKPEHTKQFLISMKNGQEVSAAVELMRQSLQTLGSSLPAMRILSPHRVIAQTLGNHEKSSIESGSLSGDFIKNSLEQLSLTEWTIMGALQGNNEIVRAAQKIIKRLFKNSAERVFFFDSATLRLLYLFNKFIPMFKPLMGLGKVLTKLFPLSSTKAATSDWRPSLPLWKIRGSSRSGEMPDYDLDPHCGLRSFSGVLPMLGANIQNFVSGANILCDKYKIEPILSILNFSDRCALLSVQLIFDKSKEQEVVNSQNCYQELSELALECKGYVYRGTIESMNGLMRENTAFWKVAERIKKALDPANIISPGRYSSGP